MSPPRIQFAPHANFRNLANLVEALEKMQWCFHMCSLAFSLFTSSVLIVYTVIVMCVCVCAVSECTNSTSTFIRVHTRIYTSICIFLHVQIASP